MSKKSPRVLVVLSNHGELAGEPNGTYAPELTHALHVLDALDLPWELASPQGGAAPLYGREADEVTQRMLAAGPLAEAVQATRPLQEVDAGAYDAVFYPGGYGLLFDLVEDADSQGVAAKVFESGGVVAAVCHGPAALSQVILSDGAPLIQGRAVTGFTREEEVAMSTLDAVPFLVEEAMTQQGATYSKRAAWATHVVRDGRLITGQNPASAEAVGRALAEALGQ